MKKQTGKKFFLKEWIELTLCDMLDELLYLINDDKNEKKIMEIIKKYSAEIYNVQSYDKK